MKLDFVVELDDDGVRLPSVEEPVDALVRVAEIVAPGAARLLPGGKISVGLTRASSIVVRRSQRVASKETPEEIKAGTRMWADTIHVTGRGAR